MSNGKKIALILEQCKARPITTTAKECEERTWWVRLSSSILISEGHEEAELDRQINQLHIDGQITRAEILLLRCL